MPGAKFLKSQLSSPSFIALDENPAVNCMKKMIFQVKDSGGKN